MAPLASRSQELLPLGVTGNTPDSGSGESWFDPRRGNSKPQWKLSERRPVVSGSPFGISVRDSWGMPTGARPSRSATEQRTEASAASGAADGASAAAAQTN